MPELPDLTIYLEALERRVLGEPCLAVRATGPFVVRSVAPPPGDLAGRHVTSLGRLGKRLVLGFDGDLHLVIHLMVAGRLQWSDKPPKVNRRILFLLEFPRGTLVLTEAGTKKRASVHVVAGAGNLAAFDRGGLEPLETDVAEFDARLRSENHTLKRSLTDPRLFAGIGNAYSDEILHRAKLSPLLLTSRIAGDEVARLHAAVQASLREWTERLRHDTGDTWPAKVTAFREDMAVHGKFRQPCPVCGSPVQRIRYADNETNYCATCQTGGRLLADRALSRLLKQDWPRSLDEMEERVSTTIGGTGDRAG